MKNKARFSPFPLRGFSLLETLFALTIFSVAVVGIVEGITAQIRAERYAEDVTRATILAQNVLEEVRMQGTLEAAEETGQFEGGDAAFEWQYTIASTDRTGLYRLTVTVSWSDGLAKKDYTIETFLADHGSAQPAAGTMQNQPGTGNPEPAGMKS